MARKQSKLRATPKPAVPDKGPVATTEVVQNAVAQVIENSFGAGVGLGQFNPFNLPQGYGFPGTEQISNVNTIFKNLRWYLVSNFRQVLSEIYVEIGLVQTIVDVPVDDALKGGVKITSKQLQEEQVAELQISIDRDADLNTVGQAAKWTRLFGGGGILILTDQDPEEPLDLDTIGPDTPLEFRAVDMWELFWDKQDTEGYDPSIQQEGFEFYNYYGEQVHKSRVMRMKGLNAPSFIRPRLRGWGFSVVEALVRSINQYLKATDLSFEVLDEFKLDVYKMKNLINTLLAPGGEEKVKRRVQQANWQKNYQNALVMDSEDDFDHKQLSFSGLAETMAGIRLQVAADMRMPITKLFGTSASSGFQTDQNDMENYNSMVESSVRNKIKYDLLRICEIKCQKLFGYIPDDLEIEFEPLREMTSEQEENVKNSKFNRLMTAATSGFISTLEFRQAANKGNLFDIKLDTKVNELNPDDPQAGEIVAEGVQDPKDPDDSDDPGANREDTEKATPSVPTSVQKKDKLPKQETPKASADKVNPVARVQRNNDVLFMPNAYTGVERMGRILGNSAGFDRASYEADGGDGWIHPGRRELFEKPAKFQIDQGLWQKAKKASIDALGEERWQFVVWMYRKLGGKFS